jgi:hypothetical protein
MRKEQFNPNDQVRKKSDINAKIVFMTLNGITEIGNCAIG